MNIYNNITKWLVGTYDELTDTWKGGCPIITSNPFYALRGKTDNNSNLLIPLNSPLDRTDVVGNKIRTVQCAINNLKLLNENTVKSDTVNQGISMNIFSMEDIQGIIDWVAKESKDYTGIRQALNLPTLISIKTIENIPKLSAIDINGIAKYTTTIELIYTIKEE